MSQQRNAFEAAAGERFLLVLVVVILMAAPFIMFQFEGRADAAKQSGGVITAPEVDTVMRWQRIRLPNGAMMRESFYYFFDDRQVCFQRRTLGQREIMADCDSFDEIAPGELAGMLERYEAAKAENSEGGIYRSQGIEISRKLGKVVFHSRIRTRDAGMERRIREFNFQREQYCNQRWIGAQIDSNAYCLGFEDAEPALLRKAQALYREEEKSGPEQ